MSFIVNNSEIRDIQDGLIATSFNLGDINLFNIIDNDNYKIQNNYAELRREFCSSSYLCGTCTSFYNCYMIYKKKKEIYEAYKHFDFKDRNTIFLYLLGAGGLIPLKKILDENHIAVIEDCCIRVNLHKYSHIKLRDVEQLSPLRILCDIIEVKFVSLLYSTEFLEKEVNVHKYFPIEDCYQIKYENFIKSMLS